MKRAIRLLLLLALAALPFAVQIYFFLHRDGSDGGEAAASTNEGLQGMGEEVSRNGTSNVLPSMVVNNADMPYCIGDQYRRGAWIKDKAARQFDLCTRHLHRNCAAIDNFNQPNGSARIELSMRWRWHPFDCKLHEFTPASMLNLLSKKNRKMRYVGDSLNHDMSQSMQCLLGEDHEHVVSHAREDRLGCPEDEPHVGNPGYCSNATAIIEKWRGIVRGMQQHDILVVNTGAHWYGDPNEKRTSFRSIASAIAAVFNGTVIVRTTVMGHDHCEEYLEPTSQFIDDGAHQKENAAPYNWANFSVLNGMVHDAFVDTGLSGYRPLYVDMFEQRADGHVQNSFNYDMLDAIASGNITLAREKGEEKKKENMDCLHYCVPGPIHVWNELLYHVLYDILTDEELA